MSPNYQSGIEINYGLVNSVFIFLKKFFPKSVFKMFQDILVLDASLSSRLAAVTRKVKVAIRSVATRGPARARACTCGNVRLGVSLV